MIVPFAVMLPHLASWKLNGAYSLSRPLSGLYIPDCHNDHLRVCIVHVFLHSPAFPIGRIRIKENVVSVKIYTRPDNIFLIPVIGIRKINIKIPFPPLSAPESEFFPSVYHKHPSQPAPFALLLFNITLLFTPFAVTWSKCI